MKIYFLNYSVILSFLIFSFSNVLVANCPDFFSQDDIVSSESLKNKNKEA